MVDNIKEKESYEQAFYNFEPQFIAHMTEKDIDYLMKFPNIIHNRKKLEAIVSQAKGYLKLKKTMVVLVIFMVL